jgi:biopolymer transport protein ExbB
MNFRAFPLLLLLGAAVVQGADPLAEASARASTEYAERLKTATEELAATRARIDAARTPLVTSAHAAEARLVALEGEILGLQMQQDTGGEQRQQMRREADEAKRNLGYVLNQAQETLKALEDSLLPGEQAVWRERVEPLRREFESASAPASVPAALAAVELVAERVVRQLGGFTASGQAVVRGDNRIVPGTFLFLGPESFFQGDHSAIVGAVRLRPGGEWPMVEPIEGWSAETADTVFKLGHGGVALDASGGKALALQESADGILDEVRKGGVVGLVILAVGAFALVIAIQKLFDFRRLAVDEPPAVRRVLGLLASGDQAEAERAVHTLKATTRALFTLALQHRYKPKAILEEHLESFVLEQRMLQERRLPLLAVVATSGPLLGLLGTVAGMIKTFTAISVFGAGSAGKLSAGISEALIATKFGLMVAIPALVVHGFLSQRIQKHLAMLDRYALEIVTACEESRREKTAGEGVQV